jgi:hypothetical protein
MTNRIKVLKSETNGKVNKITLEVKIPCPGHAPLIGEELKKTLGVTGFRFSLPNYFEIEYDSSLISEEKLLKLPIFNNFPAFKKNV